MSWYWLTERVVRLCANCGQPITGRTRSARRSPAGWSHDQWGGWEGIRCPGRITGATPGPDTATAGEWRERQAAKDKTDAESWAHHRATGKMYDEQCMGAVLDALGAS